MRRSHLFTSLLLLVVAMPCFADNNSFVNHLYSDVLGRAGSEGETQYWVRQLAPNDIAGRRRIARAFMMSNENFFNMAQSWAHRYLNRDATNSEVSYWSETISVFGASKEDIQADIVASDEYARLAGPSNRAFVEKVFHDVLRRPALPDELNRWTTTVEIQSRAAVARLVFASDEYRGMTIKSWYRDYLKRYASGREVAYWATIAARGESLLPIEIEVLSSNEYLDRQ